MLSKYNSALNENRYRLQVRIILNN